jgi:hypothetical protein
MPLIKKFGGLVPRLPEHALNPGMAVEALDVSLRSGRLEPWRERAFLYQTAPEIVSFFMAGCCLYVWDTCVQATDYLPDYNRLFVTGRRERAEVTPLTGCASSYQYLGVPAPVTPPGVQGAEAFGEDCDARSYVYTYINGYGEESAPSPPSGQITVRDGVAVSVSGFAEPPADWGIIGLAVYRSVTGSRMEDDLKIQAPVTGYFQVAVLTGTPSGYADSLAARNLGRILETYDNRPPPFGLRHISHLNGTGTLAGVTGSQVHFSENFQPWNWPAQYDLTLPANIVNMKALDTTVFVTTDRKPFVINASNICDPDKGRPVIDVDHPLPDISNSAAVTPFGLVYGSAGGLILLKPDGAWQLLTAPWFSQKDWREIRPETLRLAYWDGFLFFTTAAAGYMLSLDSQTYQDSDTGQLSKISDRPAAMTLSPSGELLMLESGAVWQWNAGDSCRKYLWTSGPLSFAGEASPNSMKVRSGGPVFVSVKSRKHGPEYGRYVSDEKAFRLKRLGRHKDYFVTVTGKYPVEYLELGTSRTTLAAGV